MLDAEVGGARGGFFRIPLGTRLPWDLLRVPWFPPPEDDDDDRLLRLLLKVEKCLGEPVMADVEDGGPKFALSSRLLLKGKDTFISFRLYF